MVQFIVHQQTSEGQCGKEVVSSKRTRCMRQETIRGAEAND